MKHLLYTLILVATLLSLSGCGAERAVRKGDKHQTLGEYYDAAVQYRKAYRQLSPKEREQRGKVALKMARCYERTNSIWSSIFFHMTVNAISLQALSMLQDML